MKKPNVFRLYDVICSETSELIYSCDDILRKIFGNSYVFRNRESYVYAIGEAPMMLVAHVDTLRDDERVELRHENGRVYNKRGILGADDRAGVYAIFSILKKLDRFDIFPSILLTNYEESGFFGVNSFIHDSFWSGRDTLFIGVDRRGKNECVFYSDVDKSVKKYVFSFGYEESTGVMSDVFFLTSSYKVPHVNLSIGYYDNHTYNEYLVISELNENIERICSMILNPYVTTK